MAAIFFLAGGPRIVRMMVGAGQPGRASTMGLHVTPEGVLGGGRLLVGNVGGWLTAYLSDAESACCRGCDLAAAMRDAILRRVSGRGAARIHVSGMSDSWLRMHEADHDKHHAGL